jgi:hypothetical protein
VRHGFTAAGLALVALALGLVLRAPMPPLQDFNEWIYQGWLVGQILAGEPVPFGIKPWPVPNAAAQLLLGALNLAIDAWAAGVAYLVLYLAGATWLAAAIARTDGGFDPATFLLALLIGALNSPFWDGYANSQLGMGLYLLHVLRERRAPTGAAWDLALGLALFLCHAVMLAVFLLHVAIACVQRRDFARSWVLGPPLALMAWYLLRDDGYGEAIPAFGTSVFEFVAYKAYSAAKAGPYQNFFLGAVGDADRAPVLYAAGVGANLLFVLVAVLPLAAALLHRVWQGDRSPAVLTAVACLAGFVVLPSAMFGVVNVGERLLLPALLVALACCPDPWRLRRIGAAVAALAPVTLLHLHLILPAAPPEGRIGHLSAHDPAQRMRVLFWHRPFQFAAQFDAAMRGEAVKLGFATSMLRPVAR